MPEKRRLAHETYQSLLAKAAKYDDPNNLDWEWGDHIPKMERHAINAAVDLRDTLAELETCKQSNWANRRRADAAEGKGKNWTAEDYRRSADSQQVAEDIIRRVVTSTLKLAYIRQVSTLDDCPEEAVFVADGLAVALGEDTGCNDPEDLNADNCELLFVEKELRELLKRGLPEASNG